MGDVLEFPSRQAQGLAFLDRQIRDLLTAKGADEALVDHAASQLNRIYTRITNAQQYQFTVRLPDAISETERRALQTDVETGLEQLRRDNHRLLVELVAELVLAEMKGFELSRR